MKKIYNMPMLHVVSINKNDIIATSNTLGIGDPGSADNAEAPDRFRDFDAGY